MKYLLLILAALAIASCSSPIDVKTPRQKDLDSLTTQTTVRATSMSLTVSADNSITQYQFATSGMAIIDTAGSTPTLWLTFTGTAPAGSEASMVLRSLVLHFDSLKVGNSQISIVGGPTEKVGADMVVVLQQGAQPQHYIPDGSTRTVAMMFALNKTTRTLTATFEANPNPGGRPLLMSGTLTINY